MKVYPIIFGIGLTLAAGCNSSNGHPIDRSPVRMLVTPSSPRTGGFLRIRYVTDIRNSYIGAGLDVVLKRNGKPYRLLISRQVSNPKGEALPPVMPIGSAIDLVKTGAGLRRSNWWRYPSDDTSCVRPSRYARPIGLCRCGYAARLLFGADDR